MQRNAKRLEQRSFTVGKTFRHPMDETVGPSQERAEPSIGRPVTGEANIGAEVIEPAVALRATAARVRRIEHDVLAASWTRFDRCGDLVAENERPRQNRIADRAFFEPVAVRAAQPNCGHAQQDFARAGLRYRLLLQTKVPRPAELQRLHCWP
jgi:hypothetical protein